MIIYCAPHTAYHNFVLSASLLLCYSFCFKGFSTLVCIAREYERDRERERARRVDKATRRERVFAVREPTQRKLGRVVVVRNAPTISCLSSSSDVSPPPLHSKQPDRCARRAGGYTHCAVFAMSSCGLLLLLCGARERERARLREQQQ